MIDTDRYEGHTEGPWNVIEKANDYQTTDVVVGKTIVASNVSPSDYALIADAPLLLTEVKELRRQIKVAQGVFEYLYHFHGADKSEDAHWIRWFCNMESEEE